MLVGGLSPAEATAEVKAFFARPADVEVGKVTLRATPKQLGASAYVGDAIRRARIAPPGANVPLKVAAPQPRDRAVRALAREAVRPRAGRLPAPAARLEAVRDEGEAGTAAAAGSSLCAISSGA